MIRRLFGADPVDQHIQRIEQEILGWVGTVWDLPSLRSVTPYPWRILNQVDHPHHGPLKESLRTLASRWPPSDLGEMVADMYFNPSRWRNRYEFADRRGWVIEEILGACIQSNPPPDIHARLEARLTRMLESPCDYPEVSPIELRGSRSYPPRLYLVSTLSECLGLLTALPDDPASLALTARIVMGEMDFGPLDLSAFYSVRREWRVVGRSYAMHSDALQPHFPRLMERLFHHGQLPYEAFCASVQHLPGILTQASRIRYPGGRRTHFHEAVGAAFSQAVLEYCDRLVWELTQSLSEDNFQLLGKITGLRGSRYLVAAARHHSSLGLGRLEARPSGGLSSAVVHLARAEDVEPDAAEERHELAQELRAFPAPTLRHLLPIAPHGRRILCEALGWEHALPLIEVIARTARMDATHWEGQDISNSPDPTEGILDVGAVRRALGESGDKLARELLKLFRQAKLNASQAMKLIEAVVGWNRDQIEGGLAKRHQISIKAYGLLPLTRGEDETLERFLELQRIDRESKQMGVMRASNVRAAVRVGLANLAQTAGHTDVMRLEWAMEARQAARGTDVGRRWSVGEYEVELGLRDAKPELVVQHGNQRLRSVPAAVRESDRYSEIKEAMAGVRDRAKRYRASLEMMMATGESLGSEDLEGLARLQVPNALMSGLLLHTEQGRVGLWNAPGGSIRTLDGATMPVAGPVRIAHPYHLFQSGELAAWQREIVQRRLRQPFKQAFRELYLLTPAEEDSGNFSNRFAGHVLSSRVAAGLFQSRGWTFETGGDIGVPYRLFPQIGLRACFDFVDLGHFITENETITSDQIFFAPVSPAWQEGSAIAEGRVLLASVPPLVFSEVMRDADLVVSVAHRETDGWFSEETYQRRSDLIRDLLADLGVAGVTLDGHFAHVRGKLARYRVHLGSAVIHIEPGNYLCIVPERWGQRHERLFLPFPEEGNAKFAEVISKILLLASDDKIRDESILRQIRAQRPAPV